MLFSTRTSEKELQIGNVSLFMNCSHCAAVPGGVHTQTQCEGPERVPGRRGGEL